MTVVVLQTHTNEMRIFITDKVKHDIYEYRIGRSTHSGHHNKFIIVHLHIDEGESICVARVIVKANFTIGYVYM